MQGDFGQKSLRRREPSRMPHEQVFRKIGCLP